MEREKKNTFVAKGMNKSEMYILKFIVLTQQRIWLRFGTANKLSEKKEFVKQRGHKNSFIYRKGIISGGP